MPLKLVRQSAPAPLATLPRVARSSGHVGKIALLTVAILALRCHLDVLRAPLLWIVPSWGGGQLSGLMPARRNARDCSQHAWGTIGNFLFDMSGYNKERFVVGTAMELMQEIPFRRSGPVVLEWSPENGRGIRYMKPIDGGIKKYIAVDTSWDEMRKAGMSASTFEKVDIRFGEFVNGVGPVKEVKAQSVDVILFQSDAEERLGPKAFAAAFKESARVVKQSGTVWLFREADNKTPLPLTVANNFEVNQTLGGDEEGMVCQQMLPKRLEKTEGDAVEEELRSARVGTRKPGETRAAARAKARGAATLKKAADKIRGGPGQRKGR